MKTADCVETFEVLSFPHSAQIRFRAYGTDDLGQPVECITSAIGGEPLRDSLRRAVAGEAIILGSYSPFSEGGPYREFGPIFISANDKAPQSRAFPNEDPSTGYFTGPVALRAYSRRQSIQSAEIVSPELIRERVAALLDDPTVWFVDVRFAAYGCFACRFVRKETKNTLFT